jgi:hypothetical protein
MTHFLSKTEHQTSGRVDWRQSRPADRQREDVGGKPARRIQPATAPAPLAGQLERIVEQLASADGIAAAKQPRD